MMMCYPYIINTHRSRTPRDVLDPTGNLGPFALHNVRIRLSIHSANHMRADTKLVVPGGDLFLKIVVFGDFRKIASRCLQSPQKAAGTLLQAFLTYLWNLWRLFFDSRAPDCSQRSQDPTPWVVKNHGFSKCSRKCHDFRRKIEVIKLVSIRFQAIQAMHTRRQTTPRHPGDVLLARRSVLGRHSTVHFVKIDQNSMKISKFHGFFQNFQKCMILTEKQKSPNRFKFASRLSRACIVVCRRVPVCMP